MFAYWIFFLRDPCLFLQSMATSVYSLSLCTDPSPCSLGLSCLRAFPSLQSTLKRSILKSVEQGRSLCLCICFSWVLHTELLSCLFFFLGNTYWGFTGNLGLRKRCFMCHILPKSGRLEKEHLWYTLVTIVTQQRIADSGRAVFWSHPSIIHSLCTAHSELGALYGGGRKPCEGLGTWFLKAF